MKANLKNKGRRAHTLNLPYRECGEMSFCHRQKRGKVVELSDGSKKVRPENARLSTSITLLGGEEKFGLPAGVAKAPEVINNPDIVVTLVSDSDAEKQAAEREAKAAAAAEARKYKAGRVPNTTAADEEAKRKAAEEAKRKAAEEAKRAAEADTKTNKRGK